MQIGLSLFLGTFLSAWIGTAFIFEWLNNRHFKDLHKENRLKKRKCEICLSAYFTPVFFEFWRCPFCGSINKEKCIQ